MTRPYTGIAWGNMTIRLPNARKVRVRAKELEGIPPHEFLRILLKHCYAIDPQTTEDTIEAVRPIPTPPNPF